jgi:hypothetical protein
MRSFPYRTPSEDPRRDGQNPDLVRNFGEFWGQIGPRIRRQLPSGTPRIAATNGIRADHVNVVNVPKFPQDG